MTVDAPTTPPSRVLGLPRWALWTLGAYTATVFHLFVDMHLGLFGQISEQMSVIKGLWGLTQAALLAWWMLLTIKAVGGDRAALKGSLFLTGLLSLFIHGLVALVAAPPVSDAAPWQDLSHITSLGAGYMALRGGLRQLGERPWPKGGRLLVVSVVLVLVNAAFGAPLTLEAL